MIHHHKDTLARRLAVVALFAAVGAFMLGSASADSTTEPDATALAVKVDALRVHVDDLESQLNDAAAYTAALEVDARVTKLESCMAYSDYHYLKERVEKRGRKWRLPVMVWNMADRSCRPTKAEWKPRGHGLTPTLATRR